MTDQLPPNGSLWRHRETGEKRVYKGLWEDQSYPDGVPLLIADYHAVGTNMLISEPLDDWLAWQTGAERIDKETT